MFDTLSERLQGALGDLRKKGRLDEESVARATREIRLALLEADVNFEVVKDFVAKVRERAVGEEVGVSLTPGQQVVKIVHEELTALLGSNVSRIAYAGRGPTVILLAGLNGAGKTTAAGKLALLLRKEGKQPALVAADLQRPAAVEQLEQLGRQIQVPVSTASDPVNAVTEGIQRARDQGADVVILDTAGRLHVDEELMQELARVRDAAKPTNVLLVLDAMTGQEAVAVVRHGLTRAETEGRDVVIVDTAGRLHVDEALMDELVRVRDVARPTNVLLVLDAMTGQEAVSVAEAFLERVAFDGVVLTKLDGDARGGAALSVKAVTGKPVKLASLGEKLDQLEYFHPDRMASRILGMGDVLSLIEKAEAVVEEDEQAKLEQRLRAGEFSFDDFLASYRMLRRMGPLKSVVSMIPGMGKQLKGVDIDERELARVEAIVLSMTPHERARPHTINGSRRLRIAKGSGVTVQQVNQLLTARKQMEKMMKQLGKGKIPALPGMR